MPEASNEVHSRLDADRRILLDLSLRNPLLNYRPRARGLEIDSESPEQVFQILVRDGKRMSFLPAPEPTEPATEGAAPTPEVAEPAANDTAKPLEQPDEPGSPESPSVSQTDRKLQTKTAADKLQARLLATFNAARTSIEEQGVNTLHLALGMLDWYESDSSQKLLRAPLMLVPVVLERTDARERFRIRYTEEDLGPNLSLAEKLKADYEIALPDMPDDEELDVAAYFDAVAKAVIGYPRWSVDRTTIALAFFSFGKFLMYRDLDASAWPEGLKPGEHAIVRRLLCDGFREPASTLGDDEPLDPHLPPDAVRHVVDADSSQSLAILDVKAGRNLVIQGPPGTGKSQTIANVIAEALGQGKSVLFVAEKMAALEVVKRRLDAVGLGVACLELHSRKSKKKAVLEELKRTLARGRPAPGGSGDELQMLADVRARLNTYADAVNLPIGATGFSPHVAIGEFLQIQTELQDVSPPAFEIAGSAQWTAIDFKLRLALVEQLEARLAVLGVPAKNPYWGARRSVFLPTEATRLRELIEKSGLAATKLREAGARLSECLGLAQADDRAGVTQLADAAGRATEVDRWRGIAIKSDDWENRAHDITELLDAGRTFADLHARHDAVLLPEAWGQDLLEVRSVLNQCGRHWWRFFWLPYYRARRRLASLCQGALPPTVDQRLEFIDAIRDSQLKRGAIRRDDALAASLFGQRWRAERSDWPALCAIGEWVQTLRAELRAGRLPNGLLDALTDSLDLVKVTALKNDVQSSLDAHRESWHSLGAFLEFETRDRYPGAAALEDLPFAEQTTLVEAWPRSIDALPGLAAFNQLAGRCRDDGLAGLIPVAETWTDASRHLSRAFRRRWLEALLTHAFEERKSLASFDGTAHEHDIRTFRELDVQSLRHNRARLALEHWERLPRREAGGQLGILRREFEKKTRHLPLRQLLARAGNAVKAIKPVFMMSPLSVATYLAPGNLSFDLVVFDEASQVKPVDAFGALLRGGQAVVVGDSRQLPPTRFFDRLTSSDELDDDEPSSGDLESILGLFLAQGAPERMLRWHYRSRHESLIAVSNHEFYDDRLVVFPSPDSSREAAGLVLRHLPHTVYGRGKSRTNPDEAAAVADAVMALARAQLDRPESERLTLGVAAFGIAQMEQIIDQLETRRRADPSSEAFFTLDAPEPFFVKNLENVQGDERDVIFISVGYGRTADGKVAMSFGPLNDDGGERRLNVLITRARVRCEVFTNLRADDIDLDRTQARGVHALKTFLAFAASEPLDLRASAGADTPSAFEAVLGQTVEKNGWHVRSRLGSPNCAIDVAVIDPDRPGRYRLGIESDGPTYNSAHSARDRDRLRPQVLEGLGWHLHRAWSGDWFRDPAGESDRLLRSVTQSRFAKPAPEVAPAPTEPTAPSPEAPDDGEESTLDEFPGEPSAAPPYVMAELTVNLGERDFHEIPVRRVASWVIQVVKVEGPVHSTEVARRVIEAAGIKRTGNRIQASLDAGVAYAVAQNTIRLVAEFLWHAEQTVPVARDRSALPAGSRKLDLVAPEEICQAIERVIADALGMDPAAVPSAACRLLGFPRVSDEMKSRVESLVTSMVAENRLHTQGADLVVRSARNEST